MADLHSMTFEEFNTYRLVAVPYINANSVRLTVSAGDITAINAIDGSYTTTEGLHANPATCTSPVTHTRVMQRAAEQTILSHIFHDIPKSVITPTDESTLHISANSADPTKTPVMTLAPDMVIHGKGGGLYDAEFKNPLTPDTKAFPKGQAFIVVFQIITVVGTPASPFGPYTEVLFTSTNALKLAYDSTFFGKQANVQCFYINNRGEQGPRSVFQSFIIGQ